jgi:integrase
MPTKKLNDTGVKNLPIPERGQVDYFDSLLPAFGVRVSYGGSKTWFVTTRIAGHPKLVRLTLGRYPAVSLTDAREAARTAMENAAKGIDPRRIREIEVAENRRQAELTFASVTSDFLKKYAERRLRASTVAEYKRAFARAKEWNDWPVKDIARRDIIKLLDGLEAKGQGTTADLTFAYLRRFFGWAVDRDILEASPCDRLRRDRNTVARDRVLTEAEIRDVWSAFDKIGYPFGPMFKILLLTGQRRSEVAAMRWDELRDWSGKAPYWDIPGDRTKNGLAHIVPIVPEAKALIDGCLKDGPYVFSTTGKTPSTGYSRAKANVDKMIVEAREKREEDPMPAWRLHDLRRTVVTLLNERLGIQPHIVEALVNHLSGFRSGVAGIYNRAEYLDERRAALGRWADYVAQVAVTTED